MAGLQYLALLTRTNGVYDFRVDSGPVDSLPALHISCWSLLLEDCCEGEPRCGEGMLEEQSYMPHKGQGLLHSRDPQAHSRMKARKQCIMKVVAIMRETMPHAV